MITASQLREAMAGRDSLNWITSDQITRLATPPKDPLNVQCWMNFLLKLFETGNLRTAVMQLIQCLIAQGAQPKDFAQCFLDFIWGLVQGQEIGTLFLDLVFCLLDTVLPPGPDPELDPPNYREVNRCS